MVLGLEPLYVCCNERCGRWQQFKQKVVDKELLIENAWAHSGILLESYTKFFFRLLGPLQGSCNLIVRVSKNYVIHVSLD